MRAALRGVRVLSVATNIPGPVACARLRDMGARIVKVEPPNGDALARACPAWYAALHEDVEVQTLDLKKPTGSAKLEEHLAGSDLLITSSRPSALGRLGLEWSSLGRRYPELLQVAITGYMAPEEEKPGHDLTYQARLGLVRPPFLPRTVLADMAGAERGVTAALMLLYRREKAAQDGVSLDPGDRLENVSLSEAAAAFAEPLARGLTRQDGLLGGVLPGYNLYETADGWIAVAVLERHFLARLARELELNVVTKETLASAFLSQASEAWEAWAAERDIPLVAVRQPEW